MYFPPCNKPSNVSISNSPTFKTRDQNRYWTKYHTSLYILVLQTTYSISACHRYWPSFSGDFTDVKKTIYYRAT